MCGFTGHDVFQKKLTTQKFSTTVGTVVDQKVLKQAGVMHYI